MRHLIMAGIALAMALPAAAQQRPPGPQPTLPPVVVEGARVPVDRTAPEDQAREEVCRVPGGVDVVGEQQIKDSRASNLQDVLERDMVLASSRDGGCTFAPPAQVHADGWKIAACPHRGGSVATDARGRLYTVWYTEGTEGRPDLLFTTSADGRRFSTPRRLHTAPGSIPDQARLAVDASGRGVVVWEDLTAVRRRVVMRTTLDGRRTLSPPQTLTQAVKAFAPDVVAAPGGFLIVWHEEQFPSIKTVIYSIKLQEAR